MHADVADDLAYMLSCHRLAAYECATWRMCAHVISIKRPF